MASHHQCDNQTLMRLYEQETSAELIAERYDLDIAQILDFSLNINPLGSPEGARKAAAATLAASNRYPDVRLASLRAALATRHGVGEDNLFFGAGLDDVIKLLIHALTRTGDAVLMHLPTFPRYELEARLRGCTVLTVVNERSERFDPALYTQALADTPIAMAFLCTPNNPTGEVIEPEAIRGLLRRFPKTLFVIDEALIFPLDDGAVPLIREYANAIVLRTFSKYYGLAGLRVGYALADAALLARAEVGRPPFNMAAPAAAAAVAALADTGFLHRCKDRFVAELDYFVRALAGLPGLRIRGSHANMILLDTGALSASQAAARLAAKGIIVADATSFRGLETHNVVRISLRTRPDNERLIAALSELATAG